MTQPFVPHRRNAEDPERIARERVEPVILSFRRRLTALRELAPHAVSYTLPLPWFAMEGSREVGLIVAAFQNDFRTVNAVRRGGTLELWFWK